MDTPEILQKKLYFLLEQLQNMARDLPPKYQMRLPYELLSSLANCLLNDTVFEIVKGLLEIQHVTEQHLYQQRLQFLNSKKMEEHEILTLCGTNSEKKVEELRKFMIRQKEELKQFDMGLIHNSVNRWLINSKYWNKQEFRDFLLPKTH
ncbi:DGCR6 domain containing protein [Asbolus verrucosus]|uniref:DGCR6 domain containing protein n=1 Tax=Asbolus verrucosus TaxID=1661398 RepID=A0A482W0M1_ASBVE|nr:DGCR6 domain containing protein [Asbolus verrucosus]